MGTLPHYWWECTLVQPLWRTVWRFLKTLKVELPYDPAKSDVFILSLKRGVRNVQPIPFFTFSLGREAVYQSMLWYKGACSAPLYGVSKGLSRAALPEGVKSF